ncbi:MAG: PLD nuclease N-terminal domain-containing protein [archaeon]|nr:PLD nuclease N-terminal domain-containing protein [archaeon]
MFKRKALMLASGLFFSSMALAQGSGETTGSGIVFYALAAFALLYLASLVWVSLQVLSSANKTKWKALWIIAVIVLGVFGAIFFLILGEKKRVHGKNETQKETSLARTQEAQAGGIDLYSKADIQPMASFKPSLSSGQQGQPVAGHKKMPAAFSPKPVQESELSEYAKKDEFVKPKTRDLFEQFKKEIAQPEPKPEPVFEAQPVEEPGKQVSGRTARATEEIILSPGEKTEVEELARIIGPEKNEHPKEEILNIVLEKGYSINVARAVLKELFK